MNDKPAETPAIYWRLEEWFPDLTKETIQQLKIYHDELIKFNRTVSLISAKTIAMADVIHFADSILACRIISKSHAKMNKIYDFGSGSGFPGLVYAILFPQTQVILVDSDQRKCDFLKHVISSLKLSNATVLNQTIESLPEGSVHFAMARGFASISKAILVSRKIFPKGGIFFHLKSEEWGMEVSEIPTQLCSVWTPSLAGEYKLPVGPVRFAIVQTEKIA